jgi:hypothetical protein
MTYLMQSAITENPSMMNRVAQCAAEQTVPDPDKWAFDNRRTWAASPGWADAWAYALATHESDPEYDPGKDESVITDGMILSEVQGMILSPPEPSQPPV